MQCRIFLRVDNIGAILATSFKTLQKLTEVNFFDLSKVKEIIRYEGRSICQLDPQGERVKFNLC